MAKIALGPLYFGGALYSYEAVYSTLNDLKKLNYFWFYLR